MKLSTLLFFLSIFFFGIVSNVQAVIIDACVWESPHKQRLYFFSDFHLEQELAKTQGMQIIQQAAHYAAPIVVENMFDYQGTDKTIRDHFTCESLQTLATLNPKNYALVQNLEYRQDKVFYSTRAGLSGAAMLKSVDDIIKEAMSYNDGPILNAQRDTIIDEVNVIHGQVRTIIMNSPSYTQARAQMQNNKQLFKLFKTYHPEFDYADLKQLLNLYDVHILDIRILHYIYQNQIKQNHYPHIFVCAGRFHIESIEKVLPKLGYTKIYSASQMKDNNAYDTYIKAPETGKKYKAIDIPAFFKQLPRQTLTLPSSAPSSDLPFATRMAQLFSWLIKTLFG